MRTGFKCFHILIPLSEQNVDNGSVLVTQEMKEIRRKS